MTNTNFIMLIPVIIIIIILIGALSIKDKRSKLPNKPKLEPTAIINQNTNNNTISYTLTSTYVAPKRSYRYYRNYPVKNI